MAVIKRMNLGSDTSKLGLRDDGDEERVVQSGNFEKVLPSVYSRYNLP